MRTTAYRTCPICEAICGLELAIEDERIVRVRGDREHVFSKGFLCPKGAAFGQLVHDPDRLRRPLVRRDGTLVETTWDDAFAVAHAGLDGVQERHGRDAVAVYLGNPNAHTIAGSFYARPLIRALATRSLFSASTVDQMPMHVACGFTFGDPMAIPVPDLDRTDLLVMLGANPWESNGSLCTAPDFPGRLEAIQARGGRFVVVDPRRTKTAAHADEHIAIRPGTDAFLLFGIVHTLLFDDLATVSVPATGLEELRALAAPFTPDAVAPACGVDAARIAALARELAAAPTAAVYARIGTCTVEFGTLANWLVLVINVLTGNLDRPGGSMFPLAPHDRPGPGSGRGFATGRWRSRVRELPEVLGELPAATLADEIETPGDGQVRALVTLAGNPVLSNPNGARLDRAIATLEFVVCVDPYLNETTRHADVILPPVDPARDSHYDRNFLAFAVRNTAAYSPPTLPPDDGAMDECAILARLVARGGDPDAVHERLVMDVLERAVADPTSVVAGRDPVELRAMVTGASPAERLVDTRVRLGAYGDGFGADPAGLTVQVLIDHPHGIDLGPLQPRIPEVLRTRSGTVELCAAPLAADVGRLRAALTSRREGLVLVGRRDLRSNNTWLHNLPVLVKGKERCTLQVHPSDATRLGLSDGGGALVQSRVGAVLATVEVTADVMEGVVCLPHGWGHDAPGTALSVAGRRPGVNSNLLTDEAMIDPLSGNAVLNGIPVTVAAA
jgi:anaerobic selenocysteine-containing dehydrogenase